MNVKQHLLLSNFILIIIPLAVFCISIFVAGTIMYGTYWSPVEKMFSGTNETVHARSIIYNELDQLADTDPEHKEKRDTAAKRLIVEMADLGYHIQYRLNGKEEYSNLTAEDEEKARDLIGANTTALDNINVSKGKMHFIQTYWNQNGNTIFIKAINPGKTVAPSSFSFFYTYVGYFIFLTFFFVLIATVITNLFIYHRTKKVFLEPLHQLGKAINAVRHGDFTGTVPMTGLDEFKQVGQDFKAMQQYLYDSVVKQGEFDRKRQLLLSGISHDLRTPLTSIKGYTEGLQAGIADTPEKQRRYYAAIETRAADMESLIDNLSIYNQFSAAIPLKKLVICSFSDFLYTYVEENKDHFERENIRINWQIKVSEDPVMIDTAEFHRVLDNLFTNAVKYRKTDSSHVCLRLERKENMLSFFFSDDGPGVADDKLEEIFDVFVRLDAARSHTNRGSGLGLAIVKRIVEAHDGAVRAFNDNGLTICITLPISHKDKLHEK